MIGMRVTVTVDRPLGSVHPKYPELNYPVNYGYVEGVIADDEEEQDVYILGVDVPMKRFCGTVIAVIERENDVEDKWVVAPDGVSFTTEEIQERVRFQEQYFSTKIRTFRLAKRDDLSQIQTVYAAARHFMAANGNPNQWSDGYPSSELLMEDISKCQLYVEETDGVIHAAFVLALGEDTTYGYIEDGKWLSDAPYATIHRLASDGSFPGFFGRCVAFCWEQNPHLRMDTHHDNVIMQHLAEREGFRRCGIIHLADGSPRIAYEKTD